MFLKYTHYEMREKIKSAGANWVAEQAFWLFGTARFVDGTLIERDAAVRDARHYFNTIDRQLLARRDYNEGTRLQRLVFLETGRNRVNTHFHFFIKGTHLTQYRHIKQAAEANWGKHIERAGNIRVLDNTGLTHERKHYCWKEFDDLSSETLLVECCHLAKPQYLKA
jgi:hypothetical protein